MKSSLIAAVAVSGIFLLAGRGLASDGIQAKQITVGTLLPQTWDMTYLTRPPRPAFTMAQASSYDRASNPGPKQDWFANGDSGQFIRTETNEGRTEQVMADVKGPGAAVRVWSANPHGTIRFYFDGESKPRLVAPMKDLLTGKVAPFVDPFSYDAASGANLYFPLPYAKSLKVTAEGTRSLYYHVGLRTYARGTSVETFDPEKLGSFDKEIREAADHLTHPDRVNGEYGIPRSGQFRITPGGTRTLFDREGAGTVNYFEVQIDVPDAGGHAVFNPPAAPPIPASAKEWNEPRQLHNELRNLIIRAEFDGEKTIECPLGDFFSTSPGINPLQSLPFEVKPDGTMICRLPMPFRKSAHITLENIGKATVWMHNHVQFIPIAPAPDSYLFHAQWTADYGRTRPLRDMTFLKVAGKGYWVGSNLHVSNPVPGWWGEGDEKVFVDGESFPSTFGTGSEDYYGYAWGSPQLFQRPYHAQTRVDGPVTMDHTDVHRWQLFDPIPYTKSLKFDLEMWHSEDVMAGYARTAYWYAAPGGTGPVVINRALLLPPYIEKPGPVAGALEGEDLKVVSADGGKVSVQDGFWQISGGKQLWWVDMQPGNRLVVEVPVATAGTYEVIGNFCHNHDYGIHKMKLNGQVIVPIDFYHDGLEWTKSSLGTFTLPAGKVTLEVECVGKNPKALPASMFGLDYLLLKKK